MKQTNSSVLDNLQSQSKPHTLWSRVNVAEAQPGVSTPLSWDFWDAAAERAMRGSWHDLGVLRRSEVAQPESIDDRVWAAFYGRVALNVEFLRKMSDRAPGTSGDAIERDILGSVRPDAVSHRTRARYPIIFTKAPVALRQLPKEIDRNYAETKKWWEAKVLGTNRISDAAEARAVWADALHRFEWVMRVHCRGSNMAQQAYTALTLLAANAGMSGVETALSGGYADTEDVAVMRALWNVSRKRSTLDDFIAAYGFHGPAEGQLAVPSWREDRKPLLTLLESYSSMDDRQDPQALARRRSQERLDAEALLLSGLEPLERLKARKAIRRLGLGIRLRERGKATYPRAIDVARASARVIGEDMARRHLLDEPDDIFFLLRSEAINPNPAGLKDLVAHRRERFEHYKSVDLPDTWVGSPEPIELSSSALGEPVTGIGASPGQVRGVVRVIVDPNGETQLQPDEILVCHTTDPSWGTLMLVASALVIDVGGPMSHGAIIARELGIPCVINTKRGSRELRTDDVVIVDGTAGTVERVES